MGIIAIPRILREKLTDNGAEALVEVINKADEKSKENVIELACERFERRLSVEIGKLDKRITEEVSALKIEINRVEEKFERRLTEETCILRNEISKSRADIIKWMFVFIFGQFWATTGVIFGTLFFFLKR